MYGEDKQLVDNVLVSDVKNDDWGAGEAYGGADGEVERVFNCVLTVECTIVFTIVLNVIMSWWTVGYRVIKSRFVADDDIVYDIVRADQLEPPLRLWWKLSL